eukprot:scaffold6544_cov140-Isochrysis_galbana.AAC.1
MGLRGADVCRGGWAAGGVVERRSEAAEGCAGSLRRPCRVCGGARETACRCPTRASTPAGCRIDVRAKRTHAPLARHLCSLPCGRTAETFFRRVYSAYIHPVNVSM